MEKYGNLQHNLKTTIEKSRSNYKKTPKDRLSYQYIEARLEKLERDWQTFCNNHYEILELDSNTLKSLKSITSEVYEETEELYISYKSDLKIALCNYPLPITGSSVSKDRKDSGLAVRLPKITIPIFSGKYSEWTTFRDLFISLIDSNQSLDSVQKLHYLKGHLTGEAEQLIKFVPITANNYAQCWSQLEARYNNKKYLASCILKRLFSQRNSNVESATALKELLDTTTECLNALKNLEIDVSSWDIIVIHVVAYKLDPETRKQWELHITSDSSNELPTFKQFSKFLESRFRAFEFIEPSKSKPQTSGYINKPKVFHVSDSVVCEYCSEGHKLCFCKKFAKIDFDKRHEFVMSKRMCFNCLGSNHSVKQCQKATNCRICNRRHHSLLHPNSTTALGVQISDQVIKDNPLTQATGSTLNDSAPVVSCFSTGNVKSSQVLLATALINAESRYGGKQVIRALIDQGSQASFITESTVQSLGLRKTPARGIISGVGGDSKVTSKSIVSIKIQSRVDPTFEIMVSAYVLTSITTLLPVTKLTELPTFDLHTISLADPQFDTPNKINILLGAEVYCQIIQQGVLKGPPGTPVAQSTTLGWILSGTVSTNQKDHTESRLVVMNAIINEDELLKRFWELESDHSSISQKMLTEEQQKCEDIFDATTRRNSEGRYVVRLPFRDVDPACKYSRSRDIAVNRFKALERKLDKNWALKKRYTDVIKEYLLLGHMVPVPENDAKQSQAVYLPHHAVVREDKTTTKVRVVFDASCKGVNGVSLNDTLMIGPTLQPELRHLIIRWRVHPICLTADIVKMYRNVNVDENDSLFQRLVWRDNADDKLQDYELVTVTFGTASAPYLAVKALQQVALDEGQEYPEVAQKVLEDYYMDDLMSGCQTVEEGIKILEDMNTLLGKGGFTMQKWFSNNECIMTEINKRYKKEDRIEEDKEKDTEHNLEIKLDYIMKILGLTWNRSKDMFQYSVKLTPTSGPETKRKVIASISRLFDPLGWLAPALITAKVFIQKLWLAGIGWDVEIPNQLKKEWVTYCTELEQLTDFQIPRWFGTKSSDTFVDLHGFSDASKVAYSAVVYIRRVDVSGNVHVSLVAAKTRVAPIKQVSIPRLELCGAVLVTRLLVEMSEVLGIQKNNLRAWTDSTVVLAWLNKHPSQWKTFVANRVSEILTTLDACQWAHISSNQNPADCASRGIRPADLIDNQLWLTGPDILQEKVIIYSKPKNLEIDLEKSIKSHCSTVDNLLWNKYSSLSKLVRIVAYCRRFLNYKIDKNRSKYLRKWEIDESFKCCIRQCQIEEFQIEYTEIKQKGEIKTKTSKIKTLNPYIDERGLLRAGGRLQKAQLEETTKHPILLPHRSHLTKLIIADAHIKTMHGGPQLMLSYIRTAYWIVGVKGLVKQHVRQCVICVRHNATVRNQLMGSLPSVRGTPARAFLHSGVDYAGPINVRTSKGRGHSSYKGYICLFICMATRAIHLEIVSDLTSQGFLAAFKRFVSRRGHCSNLWSDNGTNFVGASKELRKLLQSQESTLTKEIAEALAIQGTTWHFIPAHAPNFGGLWEAGIKSTKFHLKRVIGNSTLTYEEMATLLAQIEACLNSRPLSVIETTDSEESLPLTPGHFLVGEPLLTVPETNYELSPISCLKRWQLVQAMLQGFWRRWANEYLTQFLQRHKWTKQVPEPQIGDIVLIKEDDLPPAKWLIGRVTDKHPGSDHVTRVVTVKCKNSLFKRPTSKLCILPVTK